MGTAPSRRAGPEKIKYLLPYRSEKVEGRSSSFDRDRKKVRTSTLPLHRTFQYIYQEVNLNGSRDS